MNKPDAPALSPVKDWLALNRNELAWTALLVAVALFIGVFVNP